MRLIYASNYGFSVSSENAIVEYDIDLSQCVRCFHIQKSPLPEVLDSIYVNYQSDHILPHMEQVKFAQGGSKSCSQVVLENVKAFLPNSHYLHMLDYGAGGGGMLKSFLERYPHSHVFAYDVSTHNREIFEQMQGFAGFYENLEEMTREFECITLIHTLEHIADLDSVLSRLYGLLSEDGALVIQVPNVAQNLWDVFVYDHIHHFTPESLRAVCEKNGFKVFIPQKQIPRQITFVLKKPACADQEGQSGVDSETTAFNGTQDRAHFDLQRFKNILRQVENYSAQRMGKNRENPARSDQIYVFGTTPPSSFVARLLGENLKGFIDEDMRKVEKMHLGRMIYEPTHLQDSESVVLMPLGAGLAQAMREKYHLNRIVEVF